MPEESELSVGWRPVGLKAVSTTQVDGIAAVALLDRHLRAQALFMDVFLLKHLFPNPNPSAMAGDSLQIADNIRH